MDAERTNMDVAFPECPGCVAAGKRMAELERQNAQLRARLKQLEEQMEALSRAAKRQAGPFFSRAAQDRSPAAGPQGRRGLWHQGVPHGAGEVRRGVRRSAA